ncbi:MAG: flagellar protein FlaG [Campylobacterota bacterium]|nr:flagellar protein FlaG [Campylobacterota bacterium]
MELMQNVAKMQNSQTQPAQQASNTVQMQQHQAEAVQKAEINQEKLSEKNVVKIDSEKDMEALINELNDSISPFRTSLRFGFDNSSKDFYVSVIESQSNRLISRFPAEKAADFLPKIQEVNGFLFDQKG